MKSKPIIREVSEKYGVTPADILGMRKTGKLPAARHEVMVRLSELGMTAPRIGRIVRRDATTVLYHVSPVCRSCRKRRVQVQADARRAAR